MLAGMLADLLLLCALTLMAWALRAPDGSMSIVSGVCLALAFTTLTRWAMEFFLFLRTDLYYLAATITGCIDLHQTSSDMVRNALWTLVRRTHRRTDPGRWHPNDVRAARWYAPLVVLGYVVATVMLALVLLPISWHFLSTAVVVASHGHVTSPAFWDATGLLALNGAQPALAGLIKLHERAAGRRAQRRLRTRHTEPTLEAQLT
jgi:hypothetical protein